MTAVHSFSFESVIFNSDSFCKISLREKLHVNLFCAKLYVGLPELAWWFSTIKHDCENSIMYVKKTWVLRWAKKMLPHTLQKPRK